MPTFAGHPHPYHTMPAVRSLRRHPLTPLDTDHDTPHIPPVPLPVHPGIDFDVTSPLGHYLGTTPEHTRFQPRRTSTLSYQNSGARDFRDRSYSRSPRNLVVVIPPPDFPLHQGQLGNVLSIGPRHRLSQGILMPLFSSMFGQLNAIAREFNFPSTAGLCLYLHINENGILMTPRISDDSWQYLFGHLFEARPPSVGQQLPIGGSIEFDIDLNKARWFDAWVSGTLRDSDPFPPVVTSQASLGPHWRGENQTMNVDEQPIEDRWDASGSHTLVTNSRPGTLRHLPKKLSLVDRLESHGLHVSPKLQNHPDHPRDDSPRTHGTDAFSPAPQSAIPQVVKSDLEHRVNSWRATTELYPVSMTETYQPAPDVGITMGVTAMDQYALERNFRQAVNIDEYLLSVTSAGPHSPVMKSPIASSRPYSVHLDRRANGTVPLTPTTVTSWGPTDGEWHSVVSSVSRLPSPDIGERMVEDIMAPRLRAVWGNSFGWRSAMTWKEVYPYSATQTKPMVRVQLQDSNTFVPQYPNLVIYPAVGSHPDTHPSHNILAHPRSVWGSSFGWQRAVTWKKVYPYSIVTMQWVAPIQLRGVGGLVSKYPNLRIYPAIYPYLEIYPACTVEEDISRPVSVTPNESNNLTTCYPTLVIYPAVYPHFDIYPPVAEGVNIKKSNLLNTSIYSLNGVSTLYPNLVIYPAVYPHFDLYPKALQINEMLQQEVNVRLANVGCLAAEYPNVTIYPSAYPYLDIYPTQDTRMRTSCVAWGISFGWMTAKTWLRVYPLHTTTPLTTRRAVDDPSRPISRPCSQTPTTADIVGKQAIWGSSFGWKNAMAWRAVWPTAYARLHPTVSPISVHLGQQGDSSSNYPHLIIYPAAYPNFDIYPPRVAIVEVKGSQATKNNQCTINLIPYYPNLVIYPAVYPHIDIYPPFARALVAVTRGKGQSNLRRRRIEMWRAKTAAQVGLVELLANNHIWEADEPLQIDLADYAWSQTSAGPSTPPVELRLAPSISGSVHIDRRIQGSVLLTPSTATTWGPQDDDWCSDIISIERLPSPDLGQRVLDDVENIGFPHQPWRLVWAFFGNASRVKNTPSVLEESVFVPKYPHLVIYPPAYPHFELYPAWANVPTLKNQVAETFANSNRYPVLDIYPAVYPRFNIYPAVDSQVEVPSSTVPNVWHERVEVRLPSLYPNFDIYYACYPYNLDDIYPFINVIESTQAPIEASRGYPWLVVYLPVYPFIIPYPGFLAEVRQSPKPQQPPSILSLPERKSVTVHLPARYPTLVIYSAGYPWSLESIYPAVLVDSCPGVVKPQYACIRIYPTAYPFVQPYPGLSDSVHIPGALDEDEYGTAKAFLALSKLKHIDPESVVYPYFDLYPAPPTLPPQQERVVQDADVSGLATLPSHMPTITRRGRKTHIELHASVFRCLEKQPARNLKTHLQLHTEVFQDGVVWTPSGYMQDLTSLTTRKREDIPVRESQRRPPQDKSIPRPPRSASGTATVQAPNKVIFPLGQPPALPPISPLRVRSPGVPSLPSPAVSETPMPRVSSPTNAFTHKRTTSSRLSQAVKSMIPGTQRRNSSAAPVSPPHEERKEHVKDQQSSTRFPSLVDRRQIVVPPLPRTSASEFLTRVPQSSQRRESLVLQRARAYEQSTTVNQPSSTAGTKGTHSPFTLPPLPPMPPMTDVVETIEKTKLTFP